MGARRHLSTPEAEAERVRLGGIIDAEMRKQGKSQRKLAAEAGISTRCLVLTLKGQDETTPSTYRRLGAALGLRFRMAFLPMVGGQSGKAAQP